MILRRLLWRISMWFVLLLVGCTMSSSNDPEVVYITATFSPAEILFDATPVPLPSVETSVHISPLQPSPDPPRNPALSEGSPQEHIVQVGDTLYGIALAYGVSLDSILSENEFEDPNALAVGQVINLPGIPNEQTPGFKVLPDSRLVRSPESAQFNVAAFVGGQPGFIRTATDRVETRQANGSTLEETLTAAQVVERVALEYSVDPRTLLALLEFRAGWLSNPVLPEDLQTHPMIAEADTVGIDRSGLYRQLAWTANQLNWGYYGWKTRNWTTLEFVDEGVRLLYNSGLNAGTVALQYFLSLNNLYDVWLRQVDQNGFFQTYAAYFGDPFVGVIDPLVPADLIQPQMALPFAGGETWFFTGGWHGGWGSGSAWSALDFAPPDDPNDLFCYTSNYGVTAVAPGIIARSGGGVVVLDLDGDDNEATGWTVLYLHLASVDRVPVGTQVQIGDLIGRASCEGGFSTATHLHIARRYNGEWIPADCAGCSPLDMRPPFNMGGWEVVGIPNQEYQGYLERNGERRQAEQGRLTPVNRISW